MTWIGSSANLTQFRKESVNLKMGQQKLLKLENKENKSEEPNSIQQLWDNIE